MAAALRRTRLDLLPPGFDLRTGLVVDAGANRGDWTADVLRIAPGAEVLVVEPAPALHDGLRRRFAEKPGVSIDGRAVGGAAGTSLLHLTGSSHNSSLKPPLPGTAAHYAWGWDPLGTVAVEVVTLDQLVGDTAVSVLKLDVQGAEAEVLAGGRRTLRRTRFILIEVTFVPHYEGDASFAALHEILVGQGFELIGLSEPFRNQGGAILWIDACYQSRRFADEVRPGGRAQPCDPLRQVQVGT
jgi:FkbM family methyltransferase